VRRLAPVLVLLALVAGCSDGDDGAATTARTTTDFVAPPLVPTPNETPKRAYERRMQAIVLELQRDLDSATYRATASTTDAAFVAVLRSLANEIEKNADAIDAVRPPPDVAAPHRRYARGMHELSEQVRGEAARIQPGRAAEIDLSTLPANRVLVAAAEALARKGYDFER
jgi:hypothetical protein